MIEFQIGEYDSDDGELWDDDDEEEDENISEASWETESEHSILVNDDSNTSVRSRLAAGIERARIAMTKLENIFNDGHGSSSNSNLVTKQLLDVYKNCKCLDIFMNTDFFDESHFENLLEKVRERSNKFSGSTNQLVQDHVQRLFTDQDQETEVQEDEMNAICAKLCSLMKAQLVKSHDEVMSRYGGQAANFTVDDLTQSPGEDEFDLQDLMTKMTTDASLDTSKSVVEEDGDKESSGGFYKTKAVSNYEISTALYGAKEDVIETQDFTTGGMKSGKKF